MSSRVEIGTGSNQSRQQRELQAREHNRSLVKWGAYLSMSGSQPVRRIRNQRIETTIWRSPWVALEDMGNDQWKAALLKTEQTAGHLWVAAGKFIVSATDINEIYLGRSGQPHRDHEQIGPWLESYAIPGKIGHGVIRLAENEIDGLSRFINDKPWGKSARLSKACKQLGHMQDIREEVAGALVSQSLNAHLLDGLAARYPVALQPA